ncbi:RNA polymerase epsilon subunit [Gracilibacillus sp. YIM 98692]|uniref:RNA polymerase epsilon subunit n=1 Tax=Gracilibacillus sp. YIM 98692 TaxID=2663532 RepID=UPI0013D1DB7F|nr:RNA polymerase epsilon subunit [Gracilibacillus sp. YIM 98692]
MKKMLHQEFPKKVPVRERTTSFYYEAASERQVRRKFTTRKLNIEHIQQLNEAHLGYEKESEGFAMEMLKR